MLHLNAVPGIALHAVAAARHETAQPPEAVSHRNGRRGQIRNRAEVLHVVTVAEQKASDQKVDDDEHGRATDEAAVEGGTRTADDLKGTLGHVVVEGLQKHRRAVAQHHGNDGIEQDQVLKPCLQPPPISLQADEDHAHDHTHRQKNGIEIHPQKYFLRIHDISSFFIQNPPPAGVLLYYTARL